jgi:hypothetical protein
METEVDMKWATGGEPVWGPDIARTSHIGSVTSFVHTKVHFYEQAQPSLTCNTPRTHHNVKYFIYPTDAQPDCSKRMLKFTLKFTREVLLHVSVLHNHHQGATICALLEL